MNSLKQNKAIFLIIPAVILLVLVIVVKLTNKKQEKTEYKNASYVTPSMNDGRDTIDKLSDVYRKSRVEETEAREKKRQSLSTEQIQELLKEKKNKKEEIADDYGFNQTPINEEKTISTNEQPEKNRQKENKISQIAVKSGYRQKEAPVIKENKETQINETEYGGLGIYTSKQNVKNNNLENSAENFLPAILEEDTKIRQNSSVVFLLQEDAVINNINFKRGSVIFTTAIEGNYGFNIFSNYIQNAADGKKYPIKMVLYNENYIQGITYDGNISKAIKEGNRETMDNTISENVYGNDIATDAAATLAKSTVRNLSRNIVANRYQGYRVYFKKSN